MTLEQIKNMYPNKKPTIWQIKAFVDASGSFFFSRNALKFFGQKAGDFKVESWTDTKEIIISAPRYMGKKACGKTMAIFNPENGNIHSLLS